MTRLEFEPTRADRSAIDRLIDIGAANDEISAIRLALEVAPLGLEQRLKAQLQRLGAQGASPRGERSLAEEVAALREAFVAVVAPPTLAEFGGPQFPWQGFSDGNAGPQWNVWIEPKTRRAYVGVVLVGLKYDNYPIARLIDSELSRPELPRVISRVGRRDEVILRWDREAWQSGGRLHGFPEQDISGEVRLGDATLSDWKRWLADARNCLRQEGALWRRGEHIVTLKDGKRVTKKVSPSLQFFAVLWQTYPVSRDDRSERMRECVEQLRPLCDFMVRAVRP